MRVFVDMDGTLAQWNNNLPYYEMLYEQGYFLNLKPMEAVLSNIKSLIGKGIDVYTLSSYLTDSDFALQEKDKWLDIHLEEIAPSKRIFVKYGDDKSTYIEGGIAKDDYLLDDYTVNLLRWKDAGGIGVKILNGLNHTNETWKDDAVTCLGKDVLTYFNQEHKNSLINEASTFLDEEFQQQM